MDLRTILATAQQQRSIPGLLSMLRGGDPQIGGGGRMAPQQAPRGGAPQASAAPSERVSPGMMSLNENAELNPTTMQWAGDQGTLPASMNAADPYGGRTLRDIVRGGLPHAQDVDANNNPYGGGEDAIAWQNQLANNQNVSEAIGRGGRYQPEFARTLLSSGAEGGWFSYPGATGGTESIVPWGVHDDPRKENPAPGLMGMSTNNWRLLPEGFKNPGYSMRSGHIIQRQYEDKPWQYATDRGADAPWGLGGPGHGFPVSQGSSNQRGYFFPGQIEPWLYEGGPGTT